MTLTIRRHLQRCTPQQLFPSSASTSPLSVRLSHLAPLTDYASVVQETIQQYKLFLLDPAIYSRYIRDFVMSCLIPKAADNFTACSSNIVTTASYVFHFDVRKHLLTHDTRATGSVLSALATASLKFKGRQRPAVRINGMMLEVVSANQGELTPDFFLSLMCQDVTSPLCNDASRSNILKYVDTAYSGLYRYDYSTMGLYLTLILCGVFVIYTVASLYAVGGSHPPNYLSS